MEGQGQCHFINSTSEGGKKGMMLKTIWYYIHLCSIGVRPLDACEIGLHRKVAPVGRRLVGHGYELFLNFRI